MAARAEAEAARRWARYAEDFEPDDDDMPHMEQDQDSDDEDADPQGAGLGWFPGDARRVVADRRLPLQHFLRLMAGARVVERPTVAGTNDDLVSYLHRTGVIKQENVARALRVCPRDHFVPREHRGEALADSPIRLPALEFNISAPHMHAACLEALQLAPGHRFLDVGSGCGVLTAAAAFLVGPAGAAVGIDVKPAAVELGRVNLRRLAQENRAFAEAAAPSAFHVHNVFTPTAKHKGQYDRVHVGAACPPDRLASLASLLGPKGGLIVTPCGSDLRLISIGPGFTASQKVLSQVRYSNLELLRRSYTRSGWLPQVPSDAEVVTAMVADSRAIRLALPPMPSSFAADCVAILGPNGSPHSGSGGGTFLSGGRQRSTDSDCSVAMPHAPGGAWNMGHTSSGSEEGEEAEEDNAPAWVPTSMKRLGKLFTSCSSPKSKTAKTPLGSLGTASSVSSTCGMMLDDECDDGAVASEQGGGMKLDPAALGPNDAVLVGSGWQLPVHWAVLRARCEHCRAKSASGMRDAGEPRVAAPEAAPAAAAAAFVDFLYSDRLTADPSNAQGLVDVLHLATYFGAPRLAALAEAGLAALLRAQPSPDFDPVEAAPVLLALADDNGLPALAAAAADFCVHAHAQVAATPGYAALSKRQTDLITAEACAAMARYQTALAEVSHKELLPEPDSYF